MKTATRILQSLIFAGGVAFAMPAFAEEAPLSFWAADDIASHQTPEETQVVPAKTDDSVVGADELQSLAGGTGVTPAVLTEQNLTAINGGNSVTGVNVSSGQINIDSGAFNNFNGIGNFVLNTGHNNNLQSSMNVSIVLGGN